MTMRTNNTIDNMLKGVKQAVLPAVAAIGMAYGVQNADADVINGVNYDVNGRSEIVWTDDGSYGIKVNNFVDENGNVRISEIAKVNDSNFTRDSFELNSDYTFSPLNNSLIDAGIVNAVDEANSLYNNGLGSSGTLDAGSGWLLVNNGDGTDNIDNNGVFYDIATLGDYAVRERSVSASEFTNGSVIDGILQNDNLDPYLQVMFQGDNDWNLKSSDGGGLTYSSTGVNGQGIGVIPEPTAMSLIGLAGAGLLAARRLFTPDYKR